MDGLFGDDYGGEEMEEEADYKPKSKKSMMRSSSPKGGML